ncbi:MAG: trigger factor [Deltaproteobacteria bacterium]|nr:trigger factor [Deltaproteobacteria bacterium]
MNVNIETPSALRRRVTIELEPDEIKREVDRAYNQLKRSVQLKGFRPGRAPRNLLERFFGDQVRGDILQKLQKEYTDKALEENDLQPLVEPEVVTEASDLKTPQVRFIATFDLKPEVEVKDYQDLKVPEAVVQVNEEEVDRALERLRERNGTLRRVERRIVQPGDFVLASFEAFDDDKPISNSKFEERIVRVSGDELRHGLDELLNGIEVGSEVRKRRSYPADYYEPELAGKSVEWRIKASDIYERILPELDDEFAKDQGEYQNLAELRAAMHRQLERRAREEADARARQGLLDLIIERNPLEVPESLLAREQRNLELEAAAALEALGVARETAIERARQDHEDLKVRAEKRARSALILDAIAAQEKVEVTDDEVAERVAQLVTESSGHQRERLADFYAHQENREALAQVMRREKTLDSLVTRAQSSDETGVSTEHAARVEEAPGESDSPKQAKTEE